MRRATVLAVCVAAIGWAAAAARADYDVSVELKNVSPEAKQNWPVVLRAYSVFGRDLNKTLNPDGYHVYDPTGKEVPHAVEANPPADAPGNDELVFVIPRIDAGQTLVYRMANTAAKSTMRQEIEFVKTPHNLLPNGDFEQAEGGKLPGLEGGATQDKETRKRGAAALCLSAYGAVVSAKLPKPVRLNKGSWYYFGVWSKTQNVSRHGFEAGPAASFNFTDLDTDTKPAKPVAALGTAMNQCYTRDWMKVTFEPTITAWGLEHYAVKAGREQTGVEFVLDQKRHYYMEPGKTKGSWWLDDAVLMEQPEVTVRFDKTLEPLMKDGVLLFTRNTTGALGAMPSKDKAGKVTAQGWYSRPFAHQKLTQFARSGLRGQRVSLPVCVYHTRPLKTLLASPEGMALAGPGNAKLPVEVIEYCPGFGPGGDRAMDVISENAQPPAPVSVDDAAEGVRWFFVTFNIPRDAAAGVYRGTVNVEIDGVKTAVPTALAVQELAQPILRDLYVGLIYQGGGGPGLDATFYKYYGRCGFSNLMIFGGFLNYTKTPDGKQHVDEVALEKNMKLVMDNGISASVGLYSEVQVDDKPNNRPGRMMGMAYAEGAAEAAAKGLKAALDKAKAERVKIEQELAAAKAAATQPGANADQSKQLVAAKEAALKPAAEAESLAAAKAGEPVKQAYGRLIKELDAICKKHPDWPRIIHMTWDEPQHRQWSPKMGWTKEFLPDALVTLDVQFSRMEPLLKFYNVPAFDDPADWAGPEMMQWVKKQCPYVGICGSAGGSDEHSRYQSGIMIPALGYTYYHAWHHGFGMSLYNKDKKSCRGIAALAWADGMNDLKAWKLLTEAIAQAKKDGKNPAAVKAAEDYLAGVFTIFNGDQRKTWGNEPYLGLTYTWGYDQWLDEWQEQMLKHAAAISGAKWIDVK